MDDRAYDLWGIPRGDDIKFEDLSAHIHPADRDRVRAAFTATRAIVGAYEIDFRIMIGDELRWISARGQGDDAGMVQRIMFGIFIDVTGRKQAEEGRELLAGEMSHRVKNLLAIASSLTTISSRSTTTTNEMARELTLRLTALGRAHDLVRPVPGQTEAASALLGDLLSVLLAPYDDLGAFSGRIRVSVPRMSVGKSVYDDPCADRARTRDEFPEIWSTVGRYRHARRIVLCSRRSRYHCLDREWRAAGQGTERAVGYGSKLVERSVTGHLRGTIDYDWAEQGLVVTLKVDPERLAQ